MSSWLRIVMTGLVMPGKVGTAGRQSARMVEGGYLARLFPTSGSGFLGATRESELRAENGVRELAAKPWRRNCAVRCT